MGTVSLEQEVFDQLMGDQAAERPFQDLEECREFFGPEAWDRIVRNIDEREGEMDEVRWGDDDIAERGDIREGKLDDLQYTEHLPGGWELYIYSNNVIEIQPLGPGASGAGPVRITFK